MLKRILPVLILALATFSCQSDKDKLRNYVSIHNRPDVSLDNRLVKNVPVGVNRYVQVKTIPVMSNKHMRSAEIYEWQPAVGDKEAKYGLIITLNRLGRRNWMQESARLSGSTLIMLVHGRFCSKVHFESYYQSGKVKLRCYLPKDFAEKLVKDIKRNYEILNED